MADFSQINAEIDEQIVPNNHSQFITGERLNDTLHDLVSAVDDKKQDAGDYIGDAPEDGKAYARKNGEWAEVESVGGSYDDLSDKPSINGITLQGNKTLAGLGIQPIISDLEDIIAGAELGSTSVQVRGYITEDTDMDALADGFYGVEGINESLPSAGYYRGVLYQGRIAEDIKGQILLALSTGEEVQSIKIRTNIDDEGWYDWVQLSPSVVNNLETEDTENALSAKQGKVLKGLVDGKQDTIDDLAEIREGAGLGATALQSVPEGYATDAEVATAVGAEAERAQGVEAGLQTALAGKADTSEVTELEQEVGENTEDIEALKANLDRFGDVHAQSIDLDNLPKVCGYNMYIIGTGAPTITPDFIGQIYIDKSGGKVYMATATTNSASFKALN